MNSTIRVKKLSLAISLALAAGPVSADFPASFQLSSVNGTNGFVVPGLVAGSETGRAVASVGDINGDGIDDLLIGAPYASTNGIFSGVSYVIFGSSETFANPLDPSNLDGSNGFVVNGADIFDAAGISVAAAGDINGDGIGDLAIGASGASSGANYSGSTYVIFGRASNEPWPAALELSSLDGSDGFEIQGDGVYAESGAAVAAAGDVNGDGIDDLVIGAPFADGLNGRAYVVFGSSGAWAGSISLSDVNGANGFAMDAVADGDTLGVAVSGAGDVNGDGIDDIVVGATLAGTEGANAGAAYVVFGRGQSDAWPSVLSLSGLNGENGFAVRGSAQGDSLGTSVDIIADINGDGRRDLLLGAPMADPGGNSSGAAYVLFGSNQAWPAEVTVSALDGTNGAVLTGANSNDEAGTAVAAAGDVNRDGLADLVVGAPSAGPSGAESGAAYVVFGSSNGWAATLSLASLNGSNGFRIAGAAADDTAGFAVGAAGDIDNDSFDDLLVGAPQPAPGDSNTGKAYVIFDASEPVSVGVIFADGFEG